MALIWETKNQRFCVFHNIKLGPQRTEGQNCWSCSFRYEHIRYNIELIRTTKPPLTTLFCYGHKRNLFWSDK